MKKKTKVVYFCEYCRSYKLKESAILRHEKYCISNPSRECSMCNNENSNEARLIIKKYKDEKEKSYFRSYDFIKELQKSLDGCPACTLSVLRCLSVSNYNFDYAEEKQKWLSDLSRI